MSAFAHVLDDPDLYHRALTGGTGRLVAEQLSPRDRGTLVAALVRRGCDDAAIAAHTGWTFHTARRIRETRNIPPPPRKAAAA